MIETVGEFNAFTRSATEQIERAEIPLELKDRYFRKIEQVRTHVRIEYMRHHGRDMEYGSISPDTRLEQKAARYAAEVEQIARGLLQKRLVS